MKKKTIFFAVLFLTMSWLGQAQLSPDDSCNSAFEDISGTGTALGLSDDGEANITLPFDFVLDGVSSANLRVGNNGGILFDATTGNVSTGGSVPGEPGFYPLNDDIDNDYGDVYWEVLGTAPNRYAVIQWNDRPHYSNSPSGATFEVILYETSNEVKFIYQDLDFGAGNSNNDGASALILIVGANGTYQYSSNTALPAGVTCIHWTLPNIYNPVATFTATGDCANDRYTVDVNVTDLGGATSVTVSDDQGNSSQLTAAGPVVMGPYPNGSTISFEVVNDADTSYVTNGQTVYYCPPENDDCDNAIALTVNPDLNCGTTTSGTTVAATQSSQADDVTGTPNNDVWFSFVATSTSHQISLSNISAVVGSSIDMGMGLYDASAGCGSLTLVDDSDPNSFSVSGLTVGTTYMLRVYGWASSASYSAQATFDVCVGTPPSPPSNDECDNAIALTVNPDLNCGVTTPGTTVAATQSSQADDVTGTPNNDVWFSFVATDTSHQISLSNVTAVIGSSTDMGMGLYDASAGCSSLTLVDDSDPNSFTATGLTVGTTYMLRVYGWSSSSSAQADFDVCVGTTPPPPVNNDCANAQALTVYAPNDLAGNETSGDTTYATMSAMGHTSCDPWGDNIDLFYTFTVPDGQTEVAVVTSGNKGALLEAALYDSCGGTEVGCVSVWGGIDEKVFTGLTPGTTYTLQVWHDSGASQGDFTIGVIAPLNDTCERAKEVELSDLTCNHSVIGNNTVATDSGVADPSCSSYAGGDLWYSVEVPASGRLTFETSAVAGSGISDTGLAVYSGACGSLTELSCDDDGGEGYFSKIVLDGLTAGDTLYARVFEYGNNNFGDFKLCIFETPPPPVNNDCANAIALELYDFGASVGHETSGDTTYGTMSANGHDPSCDGYGTNVDLFYTFLLPPGETGIRILTEGDKGSKIEAAIYDSCGGTQYACEGRGSLKVINGLTGGQQYTLQVWHDSGASTQGEFTIALEKLPTPPSNDVCTGAWNLAVYPAGASAGNETTGNSQYATDSGTQPSCTTSAIQDFYYQFTVPSGVTDVTVLPGGAKGTKLGITVYDSCGGAEVVCEEGSYFHILHGLTSGATYTLQAWHKTADKGEYTIALEVADVPVNDDCANAKIVPSLPYINTMDASYATGMDMTCTNGMNDGVWYQFTGDGSDVTITATPDGWDNEIAVYTGTCGSLVCETRTDVHGSGVAETLTFTSVAGQVYLVDIGHYTKWADRPEGPFTIEITSVATAISDNTIDGFSYYPNPVNNSLNLSAQNDIQNVMIFDMTGKEVMNMQPNAMDTQVDMSRLNSGIYFVKVRINDQLTAFKVVKE